MRPAQNILLFKYQYSVYHMVHCCRNSTPSYSVVPYRILRTPCLYKVHTYERHVLTPQQVKSLTYLLLALSPLPTTFQLPNPTSARQETRLTNEVADRQSLCPACSFAVTIPRGLRGFFTLKSPASR
jgi:hypothetical protein